MESILYWKLQPWHQDEVPSNNIGYTVMNRAMRCKTKDLTEGSLRYYTEIWHELFDKLLPRSIQCRLSSHVLCFGLGFTWHEIQDELLGIVKLSCENGPYENLMV